MALIGTAHEIAAALAHDARFRPALDYVLRCLSSGSAESARLADMPTPAVAKIDLPDASVAIEQTYVTRERAACFFESHVMHIDVQCMVQGEEWIDVVSVGELTVSEPYLESKDLIKYHERLDGSRLRLRAGYVAIFFPEDGHMPGQVVTSPAPVRKTVVKVPVGGPGGTLPQGRR